MSMLKLNHWYIRGNVLTISTMKFVVDIQNYSNEYILRIHYDEVKKKCFSFDTLEEAVSFTEDVVAKKYDIDSVINSYNDLYSYKKKSLKY